MYDMIVMMAQLWVIYLAFVLALCGAEWLLAKFDFID